MMEERAVVPMETSGYVETAGVAALAEMSDAEFAWRLDGLKRGQERLTRLHRELMRKDIDYGVIPGTQKPTLLKPGAERLCQFYRLAPEFLVDLRPGSREGEPIVTLIVQCRLHLGTLDGPVVNTGFGAANSQEKRFQRQNAAPYELLNTILKMSEKRAFIDAVLRATATSALYTQDLEDLAPPRNAAQRQQRPPQASQPAAPTTEKPPAEKPVESAPSAPARCATPGCGKPLTAGQAEVSRRASGQPLCPSCQKRQSRGFDGPPSPPVVCAEGGCGIILSEAERLALVRYSAAFDGQSYCSEHGKILLAAYKERCAREAKELQEKEEAEKAALLARKQAELDAPRGDPFVAAE